MKNIILAFILLSVLLANPVVTANNLEQIPGTHWFFDVLTDAVEHQLLDYPIDAAREFGLSRYEAAQLFGKVFTEGISLPDTATRQATQLAIFAEVLDISDDSLSQQQLQNVFSNLSTEQLYQVNEAIIEDYSYHSSETHQLDKAIIRRLLHAVFELRTELDNLGFTLTDVEENLLEYQTVINQRFRLTLSHQPNKSSLDQAIANKKIALENVAVHDSAMALELLSGRTIEHPPSRSAGPQETGPTNHRKLQPTLPSSIFDFYRLINFSDLPASY